MKTNLINNTDLKNNITSTAINYLLGNGRIEKADAENSEVSYGYLFAKEDNELEAMFKLSTPNEVFFFGVQKGQLHDLAFDENMYNGVVAQVKSNFPELENDEEDDEEGEVYNTIEEFLNAREDMNNNFLTECGITAPTNIRTKWSDDEVTLKDKEVICRRALASLLVIQVSCDINNNNYKESLEFFGPLIEKLGLSDELNEKERRIMDGTYTQQDLYDMDWAYEAYWSLAWALGLVDDISNGGQMCDCSAAVNFFFDDCKTLDDFIEKCELRDTEEILDLLDLYYRYNWAINNKYVNKTAKIGNLNPSLVIERRRGLQWIVSEEDDWYDIEMHA